MTRVTQSVSARDIDDDTTSGIYKNSAVRSITAAAAHDVFFIKNVTPSYDFRVYRHLFICFFRGDLDFEDKTQTKRTAS